MLLMICPVSCELCTTVVLADNKAPWKKAGEAGSEGKGKGGGGKGEGGKGEYGNKSLDSDAGLMMDGMERGERKWKEVGGGRRRRKVYKRPSKKKRRLLRQVQGAMWRGFIVPTKLFQTIKVKQRAYIFLEQVHLYW